MTCPLCGSDADPTLYTLDRQVLDGHAEYNRLRRKGLRHEHIPPEVIRLERWYQRIKKADAARRKRQDAS